MASVTMYYCDRCGMVVGSCNDLMGRAVVVAAHDARGNPGERVDGEGLPCRAEEFWEGPRTARPDYHEVRACKVRGAHRRMNVCRPCAAKLDGAIAAAMVAWAAAASDDVPRER